MKYRSETVTADNGARLELATITFLGRDFTAGGAIVCVTCNACGRQWAIHGSTAEVISEGDGSCDALE